MGFSDFVIQQGNNANAVREVYRLFEAARDLFKRVHPTIFKVNFKQWHYHIVSDTMTVSCPYNSHDELSAMHFLTAFCQMGMIASYGLFVRGAMVFGKIYDKERDKIFGPAVIKAHNLETGAADWFRIVIDRSVIAKSHTTDYEDLYRSDGRRYYLNYLEEMFHLLTQRDEAQGLFKDVRHPLDVLKVHKHRIGSSIGSAVIRRKPDLLNKYISLATYHNDIINTHRRLIEQILGDRQRLEQIIRVATRIEEPTEVWDSALWGLVSLLKNDLKIASLSSNVHNRTAAYLQQLKKDLSTHIIDTICFHI
jgi:hypothetical protein